MSDILLSLKAPSLMDKDIATHIMLSVMLSPSSYSVPWFGCPVVPQT